MKMLKNKQILSSASGLVNGSCCALLHRRVMMPSKNMGLKVLSVCRPTLADKSYTDCPIDKESMGSDSDITVRFSDEPNQRSRIPVCQSDEIVVHYNGNRLMRALRKVFSRLNMNWIASIRLLTILRILNAVSIVLCAGKFHKYL